MFFTISISPHHEERVAYPLLINQANYCRRAGCRRQNRLATQTKHKAQITAKIITDHPCHPRSHETKTTDAIGTRSRCSSVLSNQCTDDVFETLLRLIRAVFWTVFAMLSKMQSNAASPSSQRTHHNFTPRQIPNIVTERIPCGFASTVAYVSPHWDCHISLPHHNISASIGQSHRWPAHRGPHLLNCFSRIRNALFQIQCHPLVPFSFTSQIRIVDSEELRSEVPAVLGHRQRCPQYFLIQCHMRRLVALMHEVPDCF